MPEGRRVTLRAWLIHAVLEEARFLARVLREFVHDGCVEAAAALSYTTVLSLVPMLAVMLASLALVPELYSWHVAIEDFIFENFIPARGIQVQTYLRAFVAQAEGLQTFGLVTLAISAIALMATVEAAFNAIWEVTTHRAWWHRGWLYLAILALGPLALTAGIAATALAAALPIFQTQLERAPSAIAFAMVPFLAIWLMFAACYKLIPYRPVAWRAALNGGALAALLFAGAKQGFAHYLTAFPQQEVIYGAFAAVPLFLLWLYLSWLVILFGAEFTQVFGRRMSSSDASSEESRA
jgi:membrane protein